MQFRQLFTLSAVLALLASTACQPIQAPTPAAGNDGMAAEGAEPAVIVLPDGLRCLWAGEGATLAFDGERLNYTCSEVGDEFVGLLGDPLSDQPGVWQVQRANIGRDDSGFVLDDSETVTFLAATLDLADSSTCAHAGMGATLAFDGKRLNYTCESEGEGQVGLLGDLEAVGAGVFLVEKALLGREGEGWVVEKSSQVAVTQINGVEWSVAAPGAAAGAEEEAMPELTGVLTGTVTYLQRIALPAGSVIEVQLQDVSRADAAAEVLASQTITTEGENVPIPFELSYDPAQIDPRFSYALSVRITTDGQLRWINTVHVGVLTRDNPVTGVEVLVDPV